MERRIIMDLSFPVGNSVNDTIPKGEYLGESVNLIYPKVDDLVQQIKLKGPGCMLFKRDLKRAYKQMSVDPGDINMLGFTWDGKVYFDATLPMGLRTSALCCQRTTEIVAYIISIDGYVIIVYLDDMGGAEEADSASEAYRRLGEIIRWCGLEENMEKACPPNVRMIFFGVLFDTVKMTLEISEDRLVELNGILRTWLTKSKATRKEIQSLIGKLSFVASCVRPGRIFLCRCLNELRGFPDQGKHNVPAELIKDVMWWEKFMEEYNGVSIMSIEEWSEPDAVLASDACLIGCGAWSEESRQFFHSTFPECISKLGLHISDLELLSIVVAIKVWGRQLSGKKIMVKCDNEGLFSFVHDW